MPFFVTIFVSYMLLGVLSCCCYLALFRRKNRPNYQLRAGCYSLDKFPNGLKRKEFYYLAGNSTLKGYFYPTNSRNLVVLAHGFRSGADEFLPLIKCLVDNGFCVFSFDATGCYDSPGQSLVGMCQPLVDLDNTLNFVQSTPLKQYNLYLIGHSLGGYAVLSVLQLHPEVQGCVALAPVCDGAKVMVQKAHQYIGPIAHLAWPFFYILQQAAFGDYTTYNAINGINSTNVPILVVQGTKDTVVPPNTISVTAHKEKITNANATFWERSDICSGHSNVWYSKQAASYQNEVADIANALKNGGATQKLLDYYAEVDDARYSQVDAQLLAKILQTFHKAV